jgi:hypothetical protein
MPDKVTMLAFDLGASTGRALIGHMRQAQMRKAQMQEMQMLKMRKTPSRQNEGGSCM